ncbi:Phosphatidylserine decarboxylase proenzyme, partial [Haemophilus influenzae]
MMTSNSYWQRLKV